MMLLFAPKGDLEESRDTMPGGKLAPVVALGEQRSSSLLQGGISKMVMIQSL